MKNRLELTELEWYTSQWINRQKELLENERSIFLDFSNTEWFDLWPIMQLVKLIHKRRIKKKWPLNLILPQDVVKHKDDEKYKPLCFLVDIGFIGLLAKWNCNFFAGRKKIDYIEYDGKTLHKLSEKTIFNLKYLGYQIRKYKDPILLPITQIESANDVENFKQKLHDYVSNYLKFYEREIEQGNFIDTFYRELAENSIEHGDGASAFISARFLRSLWDVNENSRKKVQKSRKRGKLEAMKVFMQRYENDGFLELVVVDNGRGIRGTLPRNGLKINRISDLYKHAMRPDISRISQAERLEKGKSPSTGLGECASCLEILPAIMMIREQEGGTCCFSKSDEIKNDLMKLDFHDIHFAQNEIVRGCNIQLILAISSLSLEVERIQIKQTNENTFGYISLFESFGPLSYSMNPRSDDSIFDIMNIDETPYVVDITSVSADKDTVWHIAEAIKFISDKSKYAVIIVGGTRQFANRLDDAIKKLMQNKKINDEKQEIYGWLLLNNDLEVQFVGGDKTLSNYVISGVKTRSFLREHPLLRIVQNKLHLCDPSGRSIAIDDIYHSWKHGVVNHIMEFAKLNGFFLKNTCVIIPNNERSIEFLNIYELSKDKSIRSLIIDLIVKELMRINPEVVVTTCSLVRQICAESIRKGSLKIIQVDLPNPYEIESSINSLKHFKLQKVLIFTDMIDTGAHAARIVRSCEIEGMNVISALCLIDIHKSNSLPKCGVEYSSIFTVPKVTPQNGTTSTHIVDPYTLELIKIKDRITISSIQPRSKEAANMFYNFVTDQKAVINQHCVNQSGHHFVVAIDFRSIVRNDMLNYLVHKIKLFVNKCDALIVPTESVIASIANRLADKLGINSENILWAIERRRVVKEHMLTEADENKLKTLSNKKGKILFLDDAIHQGKTLADISTVVNRCGTKELYVWIILDNRSPENSLPRNIVYDNGSELKIKTNSLLRSFFPVYKNPLSCPYCKIAAVYYAGLQAHPNTLLEEQINYRLNEIRAIDLKSAILDPWRHSPSEKVEIPFLENFDGTLKSVTNNETLSIALWELSQYEEGIEKIFLTFEDSSINQFALLAIILSKNIVTLEKLGIKSRFIISFCKYISDWDNGKYTDLFETAFLWPIHIAAEAIPMLIEKVNNKMLTSDSFLAILHSLMHRTLPYCGKEDRDKIINAMDSVQTKIPLHILSSGLLSSFFSTFTNTLDRNTKLRWALTSLANCLRLNRNPWHRIQEKLPDLISKLDINSAASLLGIDSQDDSIHNFGIFYYLAELSQAVDTLIRFGELDKSTRVISLLTAIHRVMNLRNEIKDRYQREPRKISELYLQQKIEDMKIELDKINVLLNSIRPEEKVNEIFSLVDDHIVNIHDDLILNLYENFKKNLKNQASLYMSPDLSDFGKNTFVLCNKHTLLQLVRDMTINIEKYSDFSDMFNFVSIESHINVDGTCSIFIANPCLDVKSENKFLHGRDYMSYSSTLFKFNVRLSGKYDKGKFVTGIHFSTII